jgi:hypothetical protein
MWSTASALHLGPSNAFTIPSNSISHQAGDELLQETETEPRNPTTAKHRIQIRIELHRAENCTAEPTRRSAGYFTKCAAHLRFISRLRDTTSAMAHSALNEERQLAINPIVGTSVQHNTQVLLHLHLPPLLIWPPSGYLVYSL